MKGTLEKLRRMFSGRKPSDHHQDDVTLSRFARSTSFKRASMRRSQRRPARKRAVVTNRGIYYVDDGLGDGVGGDGGGGSRVDETGTSVNGRSSSSPRGGGVSKDAGNDTLASQSTTHSQGTISYTDWIQISDDDTLDRPGSGVGERKSSSSRNFSLEGKSVPFDSPLPGGGSGGDDRRKAALDETSGKQRWSGGDKSSNGSNNLAPSAADDPPAVVSTFGSSCTSGVHSMEKPMLDVAGGGARRRQPTVVATRDQLRRSLRRISGRRAKKAARRLAEGGGGGDATPSSVMDDAFYRRLAKLPLVLAGDDESLPSPGATTTDGDKSATPMRTPFAFSRQNPITRWLEESEKLHRRSVVASDTERLLWSELVTAPPPPPPEERGRRAAKAAKRAARARTPSRKSLRRKLKSSRPRLDVPSTSAAASASASPTCAAAAAASETAAVAAAVVVEAGTRSDVVVVSVV